MTPLEEGKTPPVPAAEAFNALLGLISSVNPEQGKTLRDITKQHGMDLIFELLHTMGNTSFCGFSLEQLEEAKNIVERSELNDHEARKPFFAYVNGRIDERKDTLKKLS